MSTLAVPDALTPAEVDQLAHDEAIIADGIDVFFKVGLALCRIRDQRTYRATHATFEEYVNKRWFMSKTRAYQLIESGFVADQMSTIVDVQIENEGQARAIAPIVRESGPEAAADVLRDVEKSDGKITAKAIKAKAKKPTKEFHKNPLLDQLEAQANDDEPEKVKVTVIPAPESEPIRVRAHVVPTPEPKPVKVRAHLESEAEAPAPSGPDDDLTDEQINKQFDRVRAALIGCDPFVVGLELAYLIDSRVVTAEDPQRSAGVLLAAWAIAQFCDDDPEGALDQVRDKVNATRGDDEDAS